VGWSERAEPGGRSKGGNQEADPSELARWDRAEGGLVEEADPRGGPFRGGRSEGPIRAGGANPSRLVQWGRAERTGPMGPSREGWSDGAERSELIQGGRSEESWSKGGRSEESWSKGGRSEGAERKGPSRAHWSDVAGRKALVR